MIGGVGYTSYRAGKHVAEQSQHEAEQDAELTQSQQQDDATVAASEPAPAPAPQATSDAERFQMLSQLKELLDSGALTQEEFEAEKQRILRGG